MRRSVRHILNIQNTPPEITLAGGGSVTIGLGESYHELGANAYDANDGDISGSIVITGSVDNTLPGSYRIAYNVANSNGTPAREKVRMVHVVDMKLTPLQRAYDYLEDSMDRFHTRFDVHTDFNSGGNHATPSGWMGDTTLLEMDTRWEANCHSGLNCIRNRIHPKPGAGWVGVRWLQPDNNWAEIPDAGFDLTGATEISFYARGENGGEQVEFLAGGVTGAHPDSIQPAVSTGVITLTDQWQQYVIHLGGADLSHVISPFGWVAMPGTTFYLDEVTYNLPRNDAPRFIQSYEILNPEEEFAIANASYVYDNALALLAFLARGEADDLRRAKILADAFVEAMEKDRSYSDHRLRNAYMSGDLTEPVPGTAKLPGWWDEQRRKWFEDEFQVSTHTGNVAWAMIALLSYYERAGGDQYLDTAKKMGDWVAVHTMDLRPMGGFTGGYEGWEVTQTNPVPPEKLQYKAAEHNIDLYPAFPTPCSPSLGKRNGAILPSTPVRWSSGCGIPNAAISGLAQTRMIPSIPEISA